MTTSDFAEAPPRLLCVDDEPHVLAGLERTLFDYFDVTTAESGAEGLEIIAEEEEPFAVIMSDMRMPEMNGARFLAAARERSGDSVRVLLTGQSEMEAAISAVNEGGIFRFLMKPCPHDRLVQSLRDAVTQHRLITAEKVLLQQTLMQALSVVTEVLGLASPTAFDRADHLKRYVAHVAGELKWEEPWRFEIAAMLSQLGCVTIPGDVLERAFANQEVGSDEAAMLAEHPAIAGQLLGRIPRLESVAAMIAAQRAPADVEDPLVKRGAEVLNAALELDGHVRNGASIKDGVRKMIPGQRHPRDVLRALSSFKMEDKKEAMRSVAVRELRDWMQLEDDVLATNGSVVLRAGTPLSEVVIKRLTNFAKGTGIREPICVRIPADRT